MISAFKRCLDSTYPFMGARDVSFLRVNGLNVFSNSDKVVVGAGRLEAFAFAKKFAIKERDLLCASEVFFSLSAFAAFRSSRS